MKLKITYNVGKSKFYAIANNAAEAYEYVKTIIINESVRFPNTNEMLSGYIEIIASFKSNHTIFHENATFKIERMDEEDK